MMPSRVRFYRLSGAQLDASTTREMWQFRLQFMQIRPGADPDADYEAFAKTVKAADVAVLGRDRQGHLCSMIVVRAEVRTFDGQEFVWFWPEYGFLAPAYRGSIGYVALFMISLWQLRRKLGSHLPAYVVTIGWPSGFLSYRAIIELRLLGDPAATNWENRMVTSMAQEMTGENFEPERQRVRMRVLPRSPMRPQKTPHLQRSLEYYLQHNPDWSEGYAAVVYYRFPPGGLQMLFSIGELMMKRAKVRWRKAVMGAA